MPYFSIVIPVYNSGSYLRECYESIRSQSFHDWEVIFVDDGSTDGSAALLDKFVAHDSNVRVVHQKNRGVSAARNKGMFVARGEWISFVDPDDFVEPDYYRGYAVMCSRHPDVDIVGGSAHLVDEQGTRVNPKSGLRSEPRVYTGDVLSSLQSGRHRWYLYTVWNKIFRRSFLEREHLKFVEGAAVAEDVCFNVMALSRVSSFLVFSEGDGYCYRVHSGQVMKHITVERALGKVLILAKLVEECRRNPLPGLQMETRTQISATILDGCSYVASDRWRYAHGLSSDERMRKEVFPFAVSDSNIKRRVLVKMLLCMPRFCGTAWLFLLMTMVRVKSQRMKHD